MVDRSRQFGTWDWVLFAAMLVVSGGIGIYYGFAGRRQRTTTEFLMGGRNMQVFPVAISILVSFASAIMILGTPAEMYTAGTLYFLYMFGLLIALVLSAQMFVPLLYPLKLTSSFEVSDILGKSQCKSELRFATSCAVPEGGLHGGPDPQGVLQFVPYT